MANLTIQIPDDQITRIRNAVKSLMQIGDAVDIENPTNQEMVAKLKSDLITVIKNKVQNHEKNELRNSYVFTDIDIT